MKEETRLATEEMSLMRKLMMIQTEMKAPKNLFNKYGGYAYRNAEGILEALKPFEKEYGVVVVLFDDIVEISGRFYVKATATMTDCDSGKQIGSTAYAREDEIKKGMDGSQITGASSSYARKYALNALLCLDDSKDADSEEYHNQITAKATESKSEAKKATSKQATAPAQPQAHSKEEIKAKYQELISFCAKYGYDLKTVCAEYKLNATSSYDDFENVLRRLAFNLAMNSKNTEQAEPDVPFEV